MQRKSRARKRKSFFQTCLAGTKRGARLGALYVGGTGGLCAFMTGILYPDAGGAFHEAPLRCLWMACAVGLIGTVLCAPIGAVIGSLLGSVAGGIGATAERLIEYVAPTSRPMSGADPRELLPALAPVGRGDEATPLG